MNLSTRYVTESNQPRKGAVLRDIAIALVAIVVFTSLWPLRTVPTGHRGVITVGGAIRGIESEGFTLVWPWQKLSIFNIRAEEATLLERAMVAGGNGRVTKRIFADRNHLFLRDPSGYPGGYGKLTDPRVDGEVLGALADWLAKTLRAPPIAR